MKLKYYLRGLGIGIIVTTIILVSCFSMQKPKMTDEQIIEKAAQLGMIMPEQNSAVIAETETTEPEETEQKNEQQIAAEELQQETETQMEVPKEPETEIPRCHRHLIAIRKLIIKRPSKIKILRLIRRCCTHPVSPSKVKNLSLRNKKENVNHIFQY